MARKPTPARRKRKTSKKPRATTAGGSLQTRPAIVPELVDERAPTLSDADRAFALEYLANGFNASAAYRKAHPHVTTESSWVLASRVLGKVAVRAFVDEALAPYHMTADEAIARLAMDARADVRRLFDRNGKMLAIHDWPDEIVNSIRSVEEGPYGLRVRLNDSLSARRTILELHGKLKNPNASEALRDIAEILAEKWKG